MSENNPYSAPDADLAVENTESGVDAVKQFKRFTAWAVFGLGLITFGIYSYYWLYTRTTLLNNLSEPKNRIASWLPKATIAVVALTFLLNFLPQSLLTDQSSAMAFGLFFLVVFVAYFVLFIMWIFGFRKRLNLLSGSNKGDLFWLGGIMTFFFNVIYFQYKINQMHDKG